jgi:arylsulfatase A-like enzyme
MLTRRTLLQAGAATLASGVTQGAASSRPPNLILICADDLGYGDLGAFGSPDIRTPRLDGLVREGLKLTCLYAEPFCGPARAALMTGCYPIRVAEPGNTKSRHTVLHRDEVTLAEVLKPAGYSCAMIGKWGLGGHSNNRYKVDLLPNAQGFDMHFGTPASNDYVADTVLLRDGVVIEKPAAQDTLTTRYADETIRFMQRHRSKPFFVYLCPNMPHVALAASAPFRGRSERGLYGDTVEELDFNVGRVIDEVKRLGLEQNTYVVFTSDNGPWIKKREEGGSAGPFRSGKMSLWEGGVRVPGIVWAPGHIAGGRSSSQMVALQDFFTTFATLAGAPVPQDRVLDGLDASAFLLGKTETSPREHFAYYLWTHLQAVRQGRWKLHLPRPKDPDWLRPLVPSEHIDPEDAGPISEPLLFDLASDYRERRNVAADHPDLVNELLAAAERVREDLGDHDQLGRNVRFFDPISTRPTAPIRA